MPTESSPVSYKEFRRYFAWISKEIVKDAKQLSEGITEGNAKTAASILRYIDNLKDWNEGTLQLEAKESYQGPASLSVVVFDVTLRTVGNYASALNQLFKVAHDIIAKEEEFRPTFLERRLVWERARAIKPRKQRTDRSKTDKPARGLSNVERLAGDDLLRYEGGHARALLLFGVQDQMWPEEEVDLKYNPEPLKVESRMGEIMDDCIKEAKKHPRFFDGPNTRLVHFDKPWPRKEEETHEEKKRVGFTLGPVSWGEYIGLNAWANEHLSNDAPEEDLLHYLGESLFKDHNLDGCRLSNICGTVTIAVTRDGYLAFALRKEVGRAQGHYTSAVAENMNRYLDDADPQDSTKLVNPWMSPEKRVAATKQAGRDYQCKSCPHPFATVRRGIEEELSPSLLEHLSHSAVKLTGLVFEFNHYQPDMLFVACVDLSREKVEQYCAEQKGIDYREKDLYFVKPDFTNPDTKAALGFEKWIPSGKASLVRAIQIVNAIKRHTPNWEDVFACFTA
jgi:hypothetical protein